MKPIQKETKKKKIATIPRYHRTSIYRSRRFSLSLFFFLFLFSAEQSDFLRQYRRGVPSTPLSRISTRLYRVEPGSRRLDSQPVLAEGKAVVKMSRCESCGQIYVIRDLRSWRTCARSTGRSWRATSSESNYYFHDRARVARTVQKMHFFRPTPLSLALYFSSFVCFFHYIISTLSRLRVIEGEERRKFEEKLIGFQKGIGKGNEDAFSFSRCCAIPR